MNDKDFQKLWKTGNNSVSDSHVQIDSIVKNQATGKLNNIKKVIPTKSVAVIFGVLWVAIGLYVIMHIYMFGFDQANKFFLFSATLQLIISLIAVVVYVNQIVLVYRIDMGNPVLNNLKHLYQIRNSTLLITKVLVAQLPLWTVFYWNETMFATWSMLQWVIQGSATLLFFVVTIWLLNKINIKHKDAKWFSAVFGKELNPILEAIEYLESETP